MCSIRQFKKWGIKLCPKTLLQYMNVALIVVATVVYTEKRLQ